MGPEVREEARERLSALADEAAAHWPRRGTYTLSHLVGIERPAAITRPAYGAARQDNTDEHRRCHLTVNTASKASITLT
ncbi:hypothetical protein [Streptomyces sp. NRRL F-2580]|uniref:hypothetical protein n=1 Tax=Streptomyces sp. NRRL F-2580 TaxID=1463841 RepID=UPI0004CA8F70|nr:hypothetical protein [Streptomyces sp. NRRL F-2580]